MKDHASRLTTALVAVVGMALLILASAVPVAATTHGTKKPRTTTTTLPKQSVATTTLPVGACSTSSGVASTGPLWVPTKLVATVPPTSASTLEFYSVGTATLLGPRGWSCAELTAADGSSSMAVYPPGSANPTAAATPVTSPSQLVLAQFDYTAHVPGLDLVCPYFPNVVSSPAQEPCPSMVPAGEKTTQVTPDVVAVTDPAGIKGALAGSGGSWPVTGLVIVPQSTNLASGENVAVISCSLHINRQCPSILGDFVVREFPVPHPSSS